MTHGPLNIKYVSDSGSSIYVGDTCQKNICGENTQRERERERERERDINILYGKSVAIYVQC